METWRSEIENESGVYKNARKNTHGKFIASDKRRKSTKMNGNRNHFLHDALMDFGLQSVVLTFRFEYCVSFSFFCINNLCLIFSVNSVNARGCSCVVLYIHMKKFWLSYIITDGNFYWAWENQHDDWIDISLSIWIRPSRVKHDILNLSFFCTIDISKMVRPGRQTNKRIRNSMKVMAFKWPFVTTKKSIKPISNDQIRFAKCVTLNFIKL